jgi:hypothetical protein
MTHPIRMQALDAVADGFADDEPLFMLNMLRFNGDAGRRAYFEDYVSAFRALAAEMGIDGIEPVWNAAVAAMIAGPQDKIWDAFLIVRYPTLGAFRSIVGSEAYRTRVAPHREGALIDWRLIAHHSLAIG